MAGLLTEALADGRLNPDEHAERVGEAYSARTLGDLAGLTADLGPVETQPIVVDDRPLHVMFGSVRRAGRWAVPVRVPLIAVLGTVELDLRTAVLQRRHVVIDAQVLGGRLQLLVPEGVRVHVTGRTVMCTRDVRLRPPAGDDGPVIEVRGTMVFGSVRARNPRRRWRDRIPRAFAPMGASQGRLPRTGRRS